MPGFESLILGEKTAVIFDIGFVYTKCGFAGESGPRFIFPTQITQRDGHIVQYRSLDSNVERKKFLIAFFYQLYYRHLLVNPKDRRVVVIESILCTTRSRELIADVLYNHFEIPSALFAPAHLVSLFTLGLPTALVLDVGFKEAVVMPVYEGYTLLNSWQSGKLGSEAIYNNLRMLLHSSAAVIDRNNTSTPLSDSPDYDELITDRLLEDLMVRTSFVSPRSRASEWQTWSDQIASGASIESCPEPKVAAANFIYPLGNSSESKRLEIPSKLRELATECLFRGDNDNITLATLLLRSIQMSPIETRRVLARNIILIGGTVNIPGFEARLIEELNACLGEDQFYQLAALKGCFRVHVAPAEPNYTAWLGGAIFGALECLPGRSVERSVYLEKGVLPDWTSIIDTDLEVNTRPEVTRQ